MAKKGSGIPSVTIEEALEELSHQAEELETIYYLYIVDDTDHLRGLVTARQLVSAIGRPNTRLKELMVTDLITAFVNEDQEEVARRVARYNLAAIPVVDKERRMLGIITHDDVIDVVVKEATEDVHRLGGVAPMEENYLEAGFVKIWHKRAFWLGILFLGSMLTFEALAQFHEALETVVVLSLYIPLCISTGGNSGSQAATLVVRAMALGQLRLRDWWKVIRREVMTGMVLGAILGSIGMARILVWESVGGVYGDYYLLLALTMGMSLLGVVLFGTIAGSMLPFILRSLRFDPASASAPPGAPSAAARARSDRGTAPDRPRCRGPGRRPSRPGRCRGRRRTRQSRG